MSNVGYFSRPGFLSLGTTDILGQEVLCGGLSCAFRMGSSIPGLQASGTNNTSLAVTTSDVSRHPQMPTGRDGNVTPIGVQTIRVKGMSEGLVRKEWLKYSKIVINRNAYWETLLI